MNESSDYHPLIGIKPGDKMNSSPKIIKKKKHLEMALQNIPGHINPKVELEQYSTPSIIASDVLWNAFRLGDIKDKKVADLGCGTGIFAKGAAILGARLVWGMDKDREAIEKAREISKKMSLQDIITYTSLDIHNISRDLNNKFDTVIQNPPFGSQSRSKRGADRVFMEKSLELSPVVYSFHMAETENFLEKYWNKLGSIITHKFYYHFPLPQIYHFHKKELKDIEVIVLRVERNRN